MYVAIPRGHLGFWGGLVSGSLKLFKTVVPVAAAGATGGASAALMAAGSQGAKLAAGSKGKQNVQVTTANSTDGGSGNFLERMSSTELALLGIGGLALIAGLAGSRR